MQYRGFVGTCPSSRKSSGAMSNCLPPNTVQSNAKYQISASMTSGFLPLTKGNCLLEIARHCVVALMRASISLQSKHRSESKHTSKIGIDTSVYFGQVLGAGNLAVQGGDGVFRAIHRGRA